MNFSFIDDMVSGSAGPLSKKEVDWLRDTKQIGAILSVREGPLVNQWVESLQYLNVPVRNHAVPTQNEMKTCVDFIIEQTANGHKTDVHCAAGRGRTGTVLAGYLCKKHGISAEEAIRQIREKRRGSIEKAQEQAVRDYSERIKTISDPPEKKDEAAKKT